MTDCTPRNKRRSADLTSWNNVKSISDQTPAIRHSCTFSLTWTQRDGMLHMTQFLQQ